MNILKKVKPDVKMFEHIITKTRPFNIHRFLKLYENFDTFLIFAQNIDCGYTLEPPWRGGSNEYPQFIFWSKDKKNIAEEVLANTHNLCFGAKIRKIG